MKLFPTDRPWYHIRLRNLALCFLIGTLVSQIYILFQNRDCEMELHAYPPCVILYKENIIDGREGIQGAANGALVFIKPENRNRQDVLIHEFTHVWQYYRVFPIHQYLLMFDRYRYHAELEAFREMMDTYEDQELALRQRAADFAAYEFGVNYEEAYLLLRDRHK